MYTTGPLLVTGLTFCQVVEEGEVQVEVNDGLGAFTNLEWPSLNA